DQYINDILNNKDTFDIREYSEDYISRLKNDIYKITVLLKEEKEISIKEKQNLEIILSDISHQIRTPLTYMYVINDLLLKDSLDKKSKKDFLNKNRIQVERIEWLVTSLLKISRLDSGTIKLKLEKVKISELLNKTIEPLRIPIELKKQELIIEGNPDLIINIDFNWTLEALVNIIKNAHEHTKIAGTIKITYDTNPIYTEIIIKDNGEGISKKDIKHIFERFYKCDGKESIGIGLNMAKKIIEKENGLIEVESIKEKGTSFHLKFYKIK
ncbi:MAG: HAMP domain-containing sensor histidine kinase, partial [Bacilli bacterium]